MAQADDTELVDLVLEALEKNGSLSIMRAQLRANVFSAFEDGKDKVKHNISLDNILNAPEGILCLSIVHEFLEFLNLKNTLFVYTSETSQGKKYVYNGAKVLADKLNCFRDGQTKEPLLMTLLRKIVKVNRQSYDHADILASNGDHQYRDDQNCTYIVHEDSTSSSSQSNSHSEHSSDEKNRLHLRLPLDNSDTDTSTDSTRGKTSSEYMPNEHIVMHDESEDDNKGSHYFSNKNEQSSLNPHSDSNQENHRTTMTFSQYQMSILGTSSDSTSYIEMKPFNEDEKILLNTTGIPTTSDDSRKHLNVSDKNEPIDETEVAEAFRLNSASSVTLSSAKSIHSLNTSASVSKSLEEKAKVIPASPEYSFDFSSSPTSKMKDKFQNFTSTKSNQDQSGNDNASPADSPHQNSHSSRSSVSISDVADLIEMSETNSPLAKQNSSHSSQSMKSPSSLNDEKPSLKAEVKTYEKRNTTSDDSGDFSDSPIPSLSNISLNIHSD